MLTFINELYIHSLTPLLPVLMGNKHRIWLFSNDTLPL